MSARALLRACTPHRLAHFAAPPRRTALSRLRAAMASAASPPSSDSAIVAYVTAPNDAVATALSHALVASHLAACVNCVPGVKSIYYWQGAVCEDAEVLMVIKTRAELLGARRDARATAHAHALTQRWQER
jgi:periplasmic divalent cation tolerance protein